ncbi:hypothetical protein [Natrinema sp. H-ect4]|uniref:hypothetical protein n=1 Tax=Natrinema sp. H-ect4 TaxID=3242699 RepID=UPI0035A8CB34
MLDGQISLLKRGVENPEYIPRFLYGKLLAPYTELYRRHHNIPKQKPRILDFTSQNEFVIVILDACRYDYFEEEYQLFFDGNLEMAWASASWTGDYVENIWTEEHDLSYITAAPHISDFSAKNRGRQYRPSEHLREIIPVWDTDWSPTLGVAPASAVTEKALWRAQTQDNTRLVVHYMQPHSPFIGDRQILPWGLDKSMSERINPKEAIQSTGEFNGTQEQLPDEIGLEEIQEYNLGAKELESMGMTLPSETIKSRVESGDISVKELQAAYRDNLRYVLAEVKRLVNRVECPVVVTADHGECLGENGRFFHPDIPIPTLRKVPWFRVSDDEIGIIPVQDGDVSEYESEEAPDEQEIKSRLRQLGYVD